jgi:hypothetical protein
MAVLAPVLKHQFSDANGDPLVGGKLYSYSAGTSTPITTYTDEDALVPNANPIILDGNGECDLWLTDGNYKFVLKDSADVTQWTVDQILISNSSGAASEVLTTKYEKTHTNFQAAALTNGITAFSLPAKTIINAIVIKHSVAFAGTSITSYKISVGITGSPDLFIDNFDVLTTVADQTFEIADLKYVGSFSSATNIILTATAVGANLDQSTIGTMEIHVDTRAMS